MMRLWSPPVSAKGADRWRLPPPPTSGLSVGSSTSSSSAGRLLWIDHEYNSFIRNHLNKALLIFFQFSEKLAKVLSFTKNSKCDINVGAIKGKTLLLSNACQSQPPDSPRQAEVSYPSVLSSSVKGNGEKQKRRHDQCGYTEKEQGSSDTPA